MKFDYDKPKRQEDNQLIKLHLVGNDDLIKQNGEDLKRAAERIEKAIGNIPEPKAFPDKIDVNVLNQPDAPILNVPETVKVAEPISIKEINILSTALEKIHNGLSKLTFPQRMKVTVDNPTVVPDTVKVSNLPTGIANSAKTANPSGYVNVRLTDGDKFYRASDGSMMAGIGSGGAAKDSPATIAEILNVSINSSTWTQAVFSDQVIAYEIQCRTALDILFAPTDSPATSWTIRSGNSMANSIRTTSDIWLKSTSGTVIVEVIGVR